MCEDGVGRAEEKDSWCLRDVSDTTPSGGIANLLVKAPLYVDGRYGVLNASRVGDWDSASVIH